MSLLSRLASRLVRRPVLAVLVTLVACHARVEVKTPPPAKASAPAEHDTSDEDALIPILAEDAVRGNRLALVSVVVFSDMECASCAQLAVTLDRVRAAYGSDGVRIVFKHRPQPFHANAKLAATVSQGVLAVKGVDAFWRYHDTAYRNQNLVSPDSIRRWGLAGGLDPTQIDAGLERGAWSDKVERDMELAQRLGVQDTPSSFVNGIEIVGNQPFERFKEIIDTEITKARAIEDGGAPRTQVYRRAVAANLAEPRSLTTRRDGDEDTTTVWKIPVSASPVRGKPGALVTIVEFGDFQCPFCKRAKATLERIQEDYRDRVRIVWKDAPMPMHPRAIAAANLARSARAQKGEAAFWDVHDRLFRADSRLDDVELEGVARAAVLDLGKAMGAVHSDAFRRTIDADAELADDFDVTGTPVFFINGRRLSGAQPYEKFRPILDEEVRKAEALVRSGVSEAALYDTRVKDGKGPFEPEQRKASASLSAPFRGAANAPVVIQQFSEFQCAVCKRVEPTLTELMKAYPGKLKIVWRDLPQSGHVEAVLAAEAAREAFAQKGHEAFARIHERLFANPQSLNRDAFDSYAREIGLDAKRFDKALDSRSHRAAVDADAKAAAEAGLGDAPAFLVGPYLLTGTPSLVRFKKTVERVLAGVPSAPVKPSVASSSPAAPSAPLSGATRLSVVDVVVGTGQPARAGDTVVVHYTGTLTDGTVFDSTRRRGQPFTFTLGTGMAIKGWDQGLVGMRVGGRRKLTVPPDLAYGNHGAGRVIPPNATLLFDVELLRVN